MSNGDTTNLGPQLDAAGPRFSVIDMGDMVGPERMDTMGMLKSELRSVYEDNSMIQTINRAVADPGDALIAFLKPLMVVVALVVGFIGAALIMESHASATSATEATLPAVPEPEPAAATLVADEDLAAEFAAEEQLGEEEVVEETEPEPAVAAVEAKEPPRKVRKANKRDKRKKNKKRKKRSRRRRR